MGLLASKTGEKVYFMGQIASKIDLIVLQMG